MDPGFLLLVGAVSIAAGGVTLVVVASLVAAPPLVSRAVSR